MFYFREGFGEDLVDVGEVHFEAMLGFVLVWGHGVEFIRFP